MMNVHADDTRQTKGVNITIKKEKEIILTDIFSEVDEDVIAGTCQSAQFCSAKTQYKEDAGRYY